MTGRLRSWHEARRRFRAAAAEIGAAPRSWLSVVNTLRAEMGRPPLPASSIPEAGIPFVSCDVDGKPGLFPLSKPEPLDRGGMNTVLRAADLVAGRRLVVRKHVPAESAVEEERRARRDVLVRERLTVLPRHPIIQRFWGNGELDGEACEVFDFAKGVSLAKYAAEKGLTYGTFLDVGWHAARGLLFLQRHGLVHGDVKPQNFCVEEKRGRLGDAGLLVTLIDFDIVSTAEEQLDEYRLGNNLDGTLPYMPPENFVDTVPEDPLEARRMAFSKDVYALGMSLVRAANNRFPDSFYTSMQSLVKKKESLEEAVVELPPTVPSAVASLVRSMCRSDWKLRPRLQEVITVFGEYRRRATASDRKLPLALVAVEAPAEVLPKELPSDFVGPYRLVNRSFAPRPPSSDERQTLPLAELQDPFGRRLVGVPFVFATREEERAFYEERRTLLSDLNGVRLKHPELFPGSFRDLVRQETDGRFVVWIVRPLLEGALDLVQYLTEERPVATLGERVNILRRTAESLAVLEGAGYALPHLSPALIFFVPLPPEELTASQALATRPIRTLFDLPSAEPGRRFRLEVMGTASAVRADAGSRQRAVAAFLDIVERMNVPQGLGPVEKGALEQLADAESWNERVQLLVWIEMQRH